MEGDDLSDRMAGRFGSDEESTEDEKHKENEESDKSATRDKREENATSEEGEKKDESPDGPLDVDNIRESDLWTVKQLYLPEDSLGEEMNRVWYQFQAETQGEYQKDRHFKPLVASLGLERLEELDREEVEARLEEL